jgi:hypothetical protein
MKELPELLRKLLTMRIASARLAEILNIQYGLVPKGKAIH